MVDFFWVKALALRSLGKMLALAGKAADARVVFEDALRIYDDKGDASSVARMRDLLATVAPN